MSTTTPKMRPVTGVINSLPKRNASSQAILSTYSKFSSCPRPFLCFVKVRSLFCKPNCLICPRQKTNMTSTNSVTVLSQTILKFTILDVEGVQRERSFLQIQNCLICSRQKTNMTSINSVTVLSEAILKFTILDVERCAR